MDANNGILPLAYGIGEGETNEVWSWFLGNLRDHLMMAGMGDRMSEITFISDRAPSIAHGIANVFPEAFHGFCARHLFMNIKNKSSKFKYFEWHYWRMVKAYRSSDFQDHLNVFHRKMKATYKLLQDIGFNKWSRSQADRCRYAYLTSNSVESINSLSKHARKLPVCMLLEFFRASIQDWFFKHHNKAVSLTSTVTPYVEHKLAKRTNKSRRWQVFPSTSTLAEVRDGRKNGWVNLEDRTCSCGQWQISGIPCGHVIAVARFFEVEDVSGYVSHFFTSQTYMNTYSDHIVPLPHRSEWSDPGPEILQIVNPPIQDKRQPGRPKGKNRIPSQGEETEKKVRTCSRCKEPGHSRSTCGAAYDRTGESTSQRVRKSTSKTKSKEKVEPSQAYQSQFYQTYNLGSN